MQLAPEPEPPRVREPGGRGHGARASRTRSATASARQRAAAPDARRRGLRRPGHRGRDAEPRRPRTATDRRHHPRRREQPDRLHHPARGRALVHLLHRRREDGPRPGLPRERRRPRGRRPRGGPRLRVPAEVQRRTWSSTWSATAAGATTRATSRATPSRSCTPRSRATPRWATSTASSWCATGVISREDLDATLGAEEGATMQREGDAGHRAVQRDRAPRAATSSPAVDASAPCGRACAPP